MHCGQEPQDRAGSDVGPLRLGIVPGLSHHHDLRAQDLRDPVRLSGGIREVRVPRAHHDEAGALTPASLDSAAARLVRVVGENARAYPGRRMLATT